MTAYANQVKAYLERYQAEVGDDGLIDPHVVAGDSKLLATVCN